MSGRGRPREFSNAAEKQKAYRERKKADEKRVEQALALLAEVEQLESALLNSIEHYTRKGKEVEIYQSTITGYAQWQVQGYVTNSINPLVLAHMLKNGKLTEVRQDWGGKFYKLMSAVFS